MVNVASNQVNCIAFSKKQYIQISKSSKQIDLSECATLHNNSPVQNALMKTDTRKKAHSILLQRRKGHRLRFSCTVEPRYVQVKSFFPGYTIQSLAFSYLEYPSFQTVFRFPGEVEITGLTFGATTCS